MDGVSSLAFGALVAWSVILTIVVVLCVRQIALLTLRFEARGETFSVGDDGLDVGTTVPPTAKRHVPELAQGLAYVLHVAASCNSCRELVPALGDHEFDSPMIALLTGGGGVADRLAAEFPPLWRVIRDPEAGETVKELDIQSTPFALQVETGTVTGKAYVKVPEDLVRLVDSYSSSDAAEIAERARARGHEREGVVASVD